VTVVPADRQQIEYCRLAESALVRSTGAFLIALTIGLVVTRR
jgi:hypothetical protein